MEENTQRRTLGVKGEEGDNNVKLKPCSIKRACDEGNRCLAFILNIKMPYLYKYKYTLLENGVKKRKLKYSVRKFKDVRR